MKIVGFPIDVSRSQDGRIVRGLRTRQALIQSTLDLIQAGEGDYGLRTGVSKFSLQVA